MEDVLDGVLDIVGVLDGEEPGAKVDVGVSVIVGVPVGVDDDVGVPLLLGVGVIVDVGVTVLEGEAEGTITDAL
jgi:hypothetical protein